MADAATVIEDEVRQIIRTRGLDPSRHDAPVTALIAEVVESYQDRASQGTVPDLAAPDQVAKAVLDSVAGLGPLQVYLDDDQVEEIWINEPGRVFVARAGVSELTPLILRESQVRDLVERMLRPSGRRLDLSAPFVDATLASGERLHVVIPDVTRQHLAVNIRKYVVRARHLDALVERGALPEHAAVFLDAAIRVGLNVIVSGATQAGKTTFLNALTGSIPGHERLVTCEEVFEVKPAPRDVVGMQCRQANLEGTGEITLRRLVKEALRMRPDRLLVGEVREAESLDLLIALNAGIPGMGTIHANSAREAVHKLCVLPLLAGENVSSAFVVPTVASALDLVVHLERDHAGARGVAEILAVSGRAENGVVESADLYHRPPGASLGTLVRGSGYPPHQERFENAGVDLAAMLRPEH